MVVAQLILQAIIMLGILYIVLFKSYFHEKGKNIATKEDIAEITHSVESIKIAFVKETENSKIIFSGLFKERVDIYKTLLKHIFEIKSSIHQFQYFGNTEEQYDKIVNAMKSFIAYYWIHQPFFSKKLLAELNKIRTEFQSVFEDFYLYRSVANTQGINPETRVELINKFFVAGNKLKTDDPFNILEETIIQEMRIDLGTDKIK